MNATPKQLPRYCHCTHGSAGNLPVRVTYVTFTAVLSHKVLLRWYIITAVFTHLFGHDYVFHSYYVITLLRLYSVMSMFFILVTLLRYYGFNLLGHEYVFHSYYVITLLRYYGVTRS